MELTSSAFSDGERIDLKYSGYGNDVSPPLAWSHIPPGVRSFALICDDRDAHDPRYSSQPFNHWLIYNMSPNTTYLPEGLPTLADLDAPVLAMQGFNSFGSIGYAGPKPPPNGDHHYEFTLYALDDALIIGPGANKSTLMKIIDPHIIATAKLTGTFNKLYTETGVQHHQAHKKTSRHIEKR